jgi:hypothetical protein
VRCAAHLPAPLALVWVHQHQAQNCLPHHVTCSTSHKAAGMHGLPSVTSLLLVLLPPLVRPPPLPLLLPTAAAAATTS